MKRTILFRGKRLDNGKWVEGDLHIIECKHPHIHCGGISYLIDVDTIGEFTGLRDKNKCMIFEDDIPSKGNVIEYSFGSFNINGDIPLNAVLSKIEIIGNIHDNPELL